MMNEKELKLEYKKHLKEIKAKLKDFSNLRDSEYQHELFFCILTPQSKAEKCWDAVEKLKNCELKTRNTESCLKTRTRFYRNKTRYLIEASNRYKKIKQLITTKKSPQEIRKLLTDKNSEHRIKGLGMKEASHFLRNIGKSKNELAILDRHIMRKLVELKLIKEIPNLNEKNYLEIESKMKDFSKKVNIPLDELDLLFWKIESGRIFK